MVKHLVRRVNEEHGSDVDSEAPSLQDERGSSWAAGVLRLRAVELDLARLPAAQKREARKQLEEVLSHLP